MVKNLCRKKILYLLWSGGYGGAERHVYDLVTLLPQKCISPTVCFMNYGKYYFNLLKDAGIPVTEMKMRNGFDLVGLFRFACWFHKSDFAIVHDHISTPLARFVIYLCNPKIKIISTEHSQSILDGYGFVQKYWNRLCSKITDKYIAVSNAVKVSFERQINIDSSKVVTIPNLIDSARFSKLSNTLKVNIRNNLKIPINAIILISVGRLTSDKGFDRLIDLLFPVLSGYHNTHLVIIGEGILHDTLVKKISHLKIVDRIHLLGIRNDVAELLSASNIFVFASKVETFGIVVAEAMMAGIPTVAIDILGLNEVVENEISGILINEDKIEEEFAKAVIRLINNNNLCSRMGMNARKSALERFEVEKVLSQILEVYKNILNDSTNSPIRKITTLTQKVNNKCVE